MNHARYKQLLQSLAHRGNDTLIFVMNVHSNPTSWLFNQDEYYYAAFDLLRERGYFLKEAL